ncbi:putative oxidoreductase [BD1-7 clade bacterium]|uniref:Putative oxidoreductase n=1 Tax=BD1-7 clade bacterium TaxID=2029982 RepID=A0A5S9QD38_9GAMM|nr:putative oxidoreductase [BD1-7 clade bacterium]
MTQPIAIITGGGTGMGRALAHKLASAGHQVWICGRRSEPLEETAKQYPDNIHTVATDISTEDGRRELMDSLPINCHIDALIHHAATLEPTGYIRDLQLTDWQQAFAINVEAPLFLTQLLLHKMTSGTRVVHFTSALAHSPMPGRACYGATKATLESICRSLNREHGDSGIGFACIKPGIVDTEALREQISKAYQSQAHRIDEFLQETLGKTLLQPEYVVKFVYWLLTGCDHRRFATETWDIRDEQHLHEWQLG